MLTPSIAQIALRFGDDDLSGKVGVYTINGRRGIAIQRLMNAMRQAHVDGSFIVFARITLVHHRSVLLFDYPKILRDYLRHLGPMVLAVEGRKAHDPFNACYQYFCVP